MLTNQVHAWVDATDDEGLEEVRSTPIINNDVDQQMICDIQRAVSRLIGKASQLIGMKILYYGFTIFSILGNFTTNLAESWMHIRSKFDGGKQINRSQAGSWQGRWAA